MRADSLVGAVKIVAAAVVIALGLWLAQGPLDGPGEPQPAATVVTTAHRPAAAPTARSAPPISACNALKGMTVPVQGIRPQQLADTFNDARSEGRSHDALDIMAPLGTPVIAAAPGKVEKLFLSEAGGQTVYVRSPDGPVIYYYAHLDHYAPGLAEGQSLAKGAPIGTVGFTGNTSPAAPHLHFAILKATPDEKWWEAKETLNPYPLLAKADQPLATA